MISHSALQYMTDWERNIYLYLTVNTRQYKSIEKIQTVSPVIPRQGFFGTLTCQQNYCFVFEYFSSTVLLHLLLLNRARIDGVCDILL